MFIHFSSKSNNLVFWRHFKNALRASKTYIRLNKQICIYRLHINLLCEIRKSHLCNTQSPKTNQHQPKSSATTQNYAKLTKTTQNQLNPPKANQNQSKPAKIIPNQTKSPKPAKSTHKYLKFLNQTFLQPIF